MYTLSQVALHLLRRPTEETSQLRHRRFWRLKINLMALREIGRERTSRRFAKTSKRESRPRRGTVTTMQK